MKHYDYIEWILYKKNLLDYKIYKEMEKHLILCDECMEIFLSLIEDEEIQRAESIVPQDFTDKVMGNIRNLRTIKNKPKRKVSNDFFIYYGAVASVAIILTATGFFGRMVDNVPSITNNISKEESRFKVNSIYNFSEMITNKASKFINNFQIKVNKED